MVVNLPTMHEEVNKLERCCRYWENISFSSRLSHQWVAIIKIDCTLCFLWCSTKGMIMDKVSGLEIQWLYNAKDNRNSTVLQNAIKESSFPRAKWSPSQLWLTMHGHWASPLTRDWREGLFFAPPPLIFLWYLSKLRTDHRQIFSTFQIINSTRPGKRKTC